MHREVIVCLFGYPISGRCSIVWMYDVILMTAPE